MGTNIMKSIGGVGIMLLLLGNSFRGIIELLQQQSYLKFINVVFPLNLFIYFESSNIIQWKIILSIISIQPLLDVFHFNLVQLELVPMQFVESQEKFKFYEINADILNNIQTQIFLSIALLLIYLCCIFVIKLFITMKDQHYFYFGLSVSQFFEKIQNWCYQIKRGFEKEGLRQFLMTNSLDLLFMSFLQISSQSVKVNIKSFFDYDFLIISYETQLNTTTVKLLDLLHQLFQDIQSYILLHQQYLIISLKILNLLQFLNLKLKSLIYFQSQRNSYLQEFQFYSKEINKFNLYYRIYLIRYLTILSLVCNFSLIYLIIFRTCENKFDSLNLIIMEASVSVFCLTVALYWDLMQTHFDQNNQIILGWFHISLLLSVLIINLGLSLQHKNMIIFPIYTVLLRLKKALIKKFQSVFTQAQNQQKDSLNLGPIKNIMQFQLLF